MKKINNELLCTDSRALSIQKFGRAKRAEEICLCGKGYVSQYDNKCGHCRTKSEKNNLEKTLMNPNVKTVEEAKEELELRNNGLTWSIKRLPHNETP